LEKHARNTSNLEQSVRILEHIIHLCYLKQDWDLLNDQIVSLSKKRGQMKQVKPNSAFLFLFISDHQKAITAMIQKSIKIVDEVMDMKVKLALIETLRTVTHGKVAMD